MSKVWSIDCETIMGATQSVKNLRHEEFHRMSEDIQNDRTRPKGERKYIDQRFTDPNKIDFAIEQKLAQGAQLDRDKDALNPLTATPIYIACIRVKEAYSISKAFSEIDMANADHIYGFTNIESFCIWAKLEADQFLGFNIDQFDIPVLRNYQARSSSGIVPRIPAFWSASIDLRKVFGDVYNKGESYSTPRNLRHYVATILDQEAQQPGPVNEYLESTFTGADVAAAYVDNQMDKIIRHCTLDALMAALIAVKLGIYR